MHRARILVVDDNIDAADSLAMLLRLIGHEALAVHDGPTAIELAQQQPFEVIFLDLGMPGMDGYQVAERLQQIPTMKSAKLIAVTGWGQAEIRERSLAAGFHHHLLKPTDLSALQRVLQLLRDTLE